MQYCYRHCHIGPKTFEDFADFTVQTVVKRFQHAHFAVFRLRDNVKHVKIRITRIVFYITYLISSQLIYEGKSLVVIGYKRCLL